MTRILWSPATCCQLCTSGTAAFTFTWRPFDSFPRERIRACRRCTAREVRRNTRLRPRAFGTVAQ